MAKQDQGQEQQGQGNGQMQEGELIQRITRLQIGPVLYVANNSTKEMTAQVEGQDELTLDENEVQALFQFFQEFQSGGEE